MKPVFPIGLQMAAGVAQVVLADEPEDPRHHRPRAGIQQAVDVVSQLGLDLLHRAVQGGTDEAGHPRHLLAVEADFLDHRGRALSVAAQQAEVEFDPVFEPRGHHRQPLQLVLQQQAVALVRELALDVAHERGRLGVGCFREGGLGLPLGQPQAVFGRQRRGLGLEEVI